jgi:predicted dehydrogenase
MKKHRSWSRRHFLKTSSALAAAAGLPVWFVERGEAETPAAPAPRSANDRPGIALVGCGGMGRVDAENSRRFGEIVAVCDVDATHADQAAKQFTANGKVPAKYDDFRKVMERKDVDIVINATPDHWHTLISVAAARAGKDTYGEKPLTMTIDEGHHIIEAVREHKTIFQTGTQQRSMRKFRLACELVRNGRIGNLVKVTAWLPAGLRGGPFPTKPIPAGLNWDFWQGQTPVVDYVPQRCHGSFRYWYHYSGGTMTDWGAHHNDIARWAIGLDGPVAIEGKPLAQPIPGGYTAYSEYDVQFTYANGVIHRACSTTDENPGGVLVKPGGQRNGVKFEGSNGWIWVNREEIAASDDDMLSTPLPASADRLYVSDDHMGNFFDCVRSRKPAICEPTVGHRSASVCHLGNLALRLGRKLQWDPSAERFTSDDEANSMLMRPMRAPYDYSIT